MPDPEVRRAIELIIELGVERGAKTDVAYAQKVQQQLDEKGLFGEDTADIRHLKGLIRRSEARSSARTLGVETEQLRFMDLPFYETGRYRRFVTTQADVDAMVALLEDIRPHQIFATGHGNDPL